MNFQYPFSWHPESSFLASCFSLVHMIHWDCIRWISASDVVFRTLSSCFWINRSSFYLEAHLWTALPPVEHEGALILVSSLQHRLSPVVINHLALFHTWKFMFKTNCPHDILYKIFVSHEKDGVLPDQPTSYMVSLTSIHSCPCNSTEKQSCNYKYDFYERRGTALWDIIIRHGLMRLVFPVRHLLV